MTCFFVWANETKSSTATGARQTSIMADAAAAARYPPPTNDDEQELQNVMKETEKLNMEYNLDGNMARLDWAIGVSRHLNTLYTLPTDTEVKAQLKLVLIGVVFAILQWFCLTLFLFAVYEGRLKPLLGRIRDVPDVKQLMRDIEQRLKVHEKLTTVFTSAATLPSRLATIWQQVGGDRPQEIAWTWSDTERVKKIKWEAGATLEVVRDELDALAEYAEKLRDNYTELEIKVKTAIDLLNVDYTFDRSMGQDIIDALKAVPTMGALPTPPPPLLAAASARPSVRPSAVAPGASSRPGIQGGFGRPNGRKSGHARASPLPVYQPADERTWWQWFWGIR